MLCDAVSIHIVMQLSCIYGMAQCMTENMPYISPLLLLSQVWIQFVRIRVQTSAVFNVHMKWDINSTHSEYFFGWFFRRP